MEVKFILTTDKRLKDVRMSGGQVIVTIDKFGYYYDYNNTRYKVNDGGNVVRFVPELTEGVNLGEITIDGQMSNLFGPVMPSKLSELVNDLNYITPESDDLTNYYSKDMSYSKTDVNYLIDSLGNVTILIVDALPTDNIQTNVIYLVPKPESEDYNVREEYINTDGTPEGWEKIGESIIDTSGLLTEEELASALEAYAAASSVPTATSEIENDSNFSVDPHYVHTDNNVTNADKSKLATLNAVTISDIVTQGAEIASIAIDGVISRLYAKLGVLPKVIVSTEPGAIVTATKGTTTVTFEEISDGQFKGLLPDYGTWDISSTAGNDTVHGTVEVDEVKIYRTSLHHATTMLTIAFPAGNTGYFGKQGQAPMEVLINPSTIEVHAGTYVASVTYNGTAYTTEIIVDGSGEPMSCFCPDPNDPNIPANDITTWLMFGQVDKSYTTISQVLADQDAMYILMDSVPALEYMIRSADWAVSIMSNANAVYTIAASRAASHAILDSNKWTSIGMTNQASGVPFPTYISGHLVAQMTSDTEPKGQCLYDSQISGHSAYPVFGYSTLPSDRYWQSDSTTPLHYLGFYFNEDFSDDIQIVSPSIFYSGSSSMSVTAAIATVQVSKDNETWESVGTCTPTIGAIGSSKIVIYSFCESATMKGYRAMRFVFDQGSFLPGADYIRASSFTCSYRDWSDPYPETVANLKMWLAYGRVSGTYSSLSAVLNDTAALAKLMANEDAIEYMLRSTSWMADIANSTNALNAIGASDLAAKKVLCNDEWNSYLYNKYPGTAQPYLIKLVGTTAAMMSSDTEPSSTQPSISGLTVRVGQVVYDSQIAGYPAYSAISSIFSPSGISGADLWRSDSSDNLHYLGYDFKTNEMLLTNLWMMIYRSGTISSAPNVLIQGSVDGTTWDDVEIATPSCRSAGGNTQVTVDYCHPSALQKYSMARIAFPNGGLVPNVDFCSAACLNVWGRKLTPSVTFINKLWNHYVKGVNVWSYKGTTYYSYNDAQYMLNKTTNTWESITWNIVIAEGRDIWTSPDGYLHYSPGAGDNYYLNESTGQWRVTGSNESGRYIWHDGENTYYSPNSTTTFKYIARPGGYAWESLEWNIEVDGRSVWTDGNNIYLSKSQDIQYVLNKESNQWDVKTWNIGTIYGYYIFTINDDMFFAAGDVAYKLNKRTGEWISISRNIGDKIYGNEFWTDGQHTYYTDVSSELGTQSYQIVDYT